MATAISLLTYSNTFNIEQKVSNRQRTLKCRINTLLGPHTKALLQPRNHSAVKRQGGVQSPLCGKVCCDQAVITSVEAGPPGSLLSTPGVADLRGEVFHQKKLFLLCLLSTERPPPVANPLLFTHIISQPQTVFLHVLLLVNGKHRTQGL